MYNNPNHSDLPDSSVFEVIPDDGPATGTSADVQDYVRELLRNDIQGGPASPHIWSPVASPAPQSQPARRRANDNNGLPTPPDSPVHVQPNLHQQHATAAAAATTAMPLPSPPTSSHGVPTGQMYAAYQEAYYPNMLPPPAVARRPIAATASSVSQGSIPRRAVPNGSAATASQVSSNINRSNTNDNINTNDRALIARFEHPDLSEPSMTAFQQTKFENAQQQQQQQQEQPIVHRLRRHRTSSAIQHEREIRYRKQLAAERVTSSSCLMCGLSALLLAAIVATCRSLKRGISKVFFKSSVSSSSSTISSASSFAFATLFRRLRKSSGQDE